MRAAARADRRVLLGPIYIYIYICIYIYIYKYIYIQGLVALGSLHVHRPARLVQHLRWRLGFEVLGLGV